MALQEKQFEILPHEDALAGEGFTFGIGADVSTNDGGFLPNAAEWITQDGQNSRRGTKSFGRDVLTGPLWAWESHVDQQDLGPAVEVLERFTTAWRPVNIMSQASAVTALRYMLAGRVRRVYGRPRRLDAPPTNLIDAGYVPVGHDFQCVDAYTYDDIAQGLRLTLTGGTSGGGFILPKRFPLSTLPPGRARAQDQAAVGGTARTFPVIRMQGPWTRPGIVTNTWSLRMKGSLAMGEYVEIDTRPWKLSVLKNGNMPATEMLERRTYLEDIYFNPGERPEFTLVGDANTSGGTAEITWRNAWNNI